MALVWLVEKRERERQKYARLANSLYRLKTSLLAPSLHKKSERIQSMFDFVPERKNFKVNIKDEQAES